MVSWDSKDMTYYRAGELIDLARKCDRTSIQALDLAIQRLGIVVRSKNGSSAQLLEAEKLALELFKIYKKLQFIERF